VIVLGASEPPPFGPWAGLGLAVFWLACALGLVRLIQRAYDRDPRTGARAEARPPWWRIRVIGYRAMTAVPIAFAGFSFSFSMVGYSAFFWTGLDAVGVTSALFGLAGVGCFFWGLYDSFGPHAWRQSGRDEYTLW
jgi:hypothetical protein